MRRLLSKIFLCHTHRRFQKVFDRLEDQAYRLYVRGEDASPEYIRKTKRCIKNLGKTIALYDKFIGR